MKTRSIQLAEVLTIDRTAASDGDCRTLPYVGLEHIEKDTGHFAEDFRQKPEILLATKYRFTHRHVLYGKLRPNLNKTVLPDFDGVCTTEILPLLAHPQTLDRGYLYGALLSKPFVKWATNNVSGANLPRLDPDRLLEYEIELPDLSEQQRIAAQLQQADRLRRSRRHALEFTDTFLPAAFLELFGDPLSNIGGWATQILDTCCERFIDYRGRTPEYSSEGIPHVTSTCIKEHEIQWAAAKYVTDATYVSYMTRGLPARGDVILTTEAPLGESAVIKTDDRFSVAQRLLLIRPGLSILPDYLCHLLSHRSFRPRLLQFATGSTVKGISSESFRAIPIALPPLPIQQKFAALVEHVERLRAAQREALRQAEHLFASLLDRAFEG